MTEICTLDGCGEPQVAKLLCESHYRRWLRHGDPLAGRIRRRRNETRTCDLDGCDELHRANGLCNTHLMRRRYWGDCEWSAHAVDDIAVERTVLGEPPAKLTQGEREQAVAKLAGRMTDVQIAEQLGISRRGVQTIRYRLHLATKARPTRIRVGAGPDSRLFLAHPWIAENVARQRNHAQRTTA